MATQADRILQYMKDFGSISTLQAFTDLGCTRLSGRIFDLKQAGHKITDKFVTGRNRYNETVQYKEYSLQQKKE